jgi:hypothetical protein
LIALADGVEDEAQTDAGQQEPGHVEPSRPFLPVLDEVKGAEEEPDGAERQVQAEDPAP